ncbi:MAG: hypothetical protein P4L84_15080 [Isosphaeraceae bacterium]|nr:hypothetical protein [Isosphaeraceae bacterium]
MTPNALRAAAIGLLWLPLAGCAMPPVARYVYQDNEFGVVGIPVNTFLTKADFRAQAEELMTRHFPEGFEIVRAEEVDEGERIVNVGRKTDFETNPTVTALNQMFKLGRIDQSTSFEEKDMVHVRECRIIYKRKPPGTVGGAAQFAAVSTLAPTLYIDPNEVARRQRAEALAKNSTAAPKSADAKVQKASNPPAK